MVVFNWVSKGKELHCYVDTQLVGYVLDLGIKPVLTALFTENKLLPAIIGNAYSALNAQSIVQQMYLAYRMGKLDLYFAGKEKWVNTSGYRISQCGMYMTYYRAGKYVGEDSTGIVDGYGVI